MMKIKSANTIMGNCILVLAATWLIASCSKDSDKETVPVSFHLEYAVDDEPLFFDTIQYVNDAGNQFSVTRLQYYISGIRFIGSDDYQSSQVYYIDARESGYSTIEVEGAEGNYTGISFLIGLAPDQNLSDNLPATLENLNMAWPENMGGGYHFLKLEGHYTWGASQQGGYAVHLGNDLSLVTCTFDFPLTIGAGQNQMKLKMNVNNWFRTPWQYDFNTDGNYTMGDSLLMARISQNGHDVFSVSEF